MTLEGILILFLAAYILAQEEKNDEKEKRK